MSRADVDVATLADLLHETAEHHDSFERSAPTHDWWDWYAPYLDARLRGNTTEEATSTADRYMKEVRGVVRGAADQSAAAGLGEEARDSSDELNTILVATDGSPASVQATEFAIDLAAEHHAKLIFVHVVPTFDVTVAGDEDVLAVPREPSGLDRSMLDTAAATAAEHGVIATTALLPGPRAAEEIIAHGDENDVDLIVVGSWGHRAVRNALLGSVSHNVLRKSARPVLVVRGEIRFRPRPDATG